MAPFTARSRSSASSVLTTLDGGVARGYAGIPQVERVVAVHLCPRNAATWRNRPRLPSKACKLTAALAAKAYSAAGQAASALHAMAILQVHQAKALKQVHEGSTDPGLMQELRTATDFALRATKVTARSLGKAMSTMVVQERHLWLNLAEMKDVDKARFLDAPISQAGLFGDTVEGFAQQFSAVQQQTEAIQHILPRRDAPSTAAPGARPQSARRRGRPPASSRAAPPQAESTHRPVCRASRRRAVPPGDVGVCSFSGDGENSAAPSPGGGPGGESSVSVPPLDQGPAVPTFSKKEQFPFPPGSQVHGTTVCDTLPPHSRPRPILPVAKRVRFGDDIPPHAPLASPVRDPGSSVRMPQNAPPSVPSTPTPFRCTTTGAAGCAPLAHPDLASRTHFLRDSTSLAHSSEEGPPFSGSRHHMAPASRSMEPPCVAPGRDAADLSGLPPAVVETIIQARAPSTRQTYALKWSLFATWCSSRREDPRRCMIGVVLSFLQERLERRLSPSTLKVYVAAIAAHHDAVDGRSLGKHDLIVRFLKGARRMNYSRPPLVPSWDLSIVLAGLQRCPFEPLDSVELKFLSLKTALLTALTSIKRVGDLQAFSVSEECLVFGPVYSHVVLRPRPGYVPKVPTTPFRDQVVNLQALPSEEADPALALLCPVRALRIYVTRTRSIRSSEQLFVCHGGQQKGKAVSKQRLAHWIVEAIALAYQSHGEPCPLGVPLWQTPAELWAGRHRTPAQDSTIFALSQFLPVYWVSNGREELAGVTLAAPFPLTRGYERLFLPQFSSPDGEPWWNPPSTPGSQTGRSSLTPGPVLVLARPGLRSAPVLG